MATFDHDGYRYDQERQVLHTAKSSPVLKAVRTVPAEKAASLETLIRGSWAPNAIYSLCRLGVPDALTDDPADAASATELAQRLQCDAPCLLRLLRLCVAYGLLVEIERPSGGEAPARSADSGGSDGVEGREPKAAVEDGGVQGPPRVEQLDQVPVDVPRSAERGERGGGFAVAAHGGVGTEGDAGERGGESGGGGAASAADREAPLEDGACTERRSCFYLTDMGVMLQESHPSHMKWLALMLGLPGHYVSRGYLYDNVKEGRMGFEAAFGCDWYSYVASHPLEGTAFDKAMTATSTAAAQAVAAAYDFSRHKTVMDVGGGQGLLMTAILHHHKDVERGVVLELPNVVAAARKLGQRGLERLEYVEGDFFKPFPCTADCIVMRLVLHDWPDAEARAILLHARAALATHGSARLVVVEAVLPELVTPDAGPSTLHQLEFDMGMMLMTTGRERSRSEWEVLLRSAGFEQELLYGPPEVSVPFMVARRAEATAEA